MGTSAGNRSNSQPIWLLPLLAGLLPALATIVAHQISVNSGLIPSCNLYLDGCVSISKSARHDLPNHIFRALVLPAATLQGLTWILCAQWLKSLDAATGKYSFVLAWLGTLAATFLVLYGAFLGTEGETYQWLRRYGINFYFGLTYLCMLMASAKVFRLARAGWLRPPMRLDRALGVLCLLIMAFGLTNLFAKSLSSDAQLVDRLENVLEWYAATAFTLFFAGLAWLWKCTRFRVRAGCQI
jgi:hypothetical protein